MKFTVLLLFSIIIGSYLSLSKTSIDLKAIKKDPLDFITFQREGGRRVLQQTNISLNDFLNLQYFGNITVGSNKQNFTVMFDTGSSDFWLPGPEINWTKHQYHCEQSESCNQTTVNKTIKYGIGSVSGTFVQDIAWIGDLKSPNQPILVVNSSINQEGRNQFDGIIGMGNTLFNTLWGNNSLLTQLYTAGQIPSRSFSMHLQRNPSKEIEIAGSLMIGGYEEKYLRNGKDFQYFPVVDMRHWSIPLHAANFGELNITIENVTNLTAYPYFNGSFSPNRILIDSGTSGFLLPSKVYNQIYAYLNEKIGCELEDTAILCFCEDIEEVMPSFNFTSMNYIFSIPVKNFLEPVDEEICMLIITPVNANNQMWVVGTSFFWEYYVYYHMDNQTIGFSGNIMEIVKPHPESKYKWYLIIAIMVLMGILAVTAIVACIRKRRSDMEYKAYRDGLNISLIQVD